nr:MAG TPA: hypothetical protein [Caudoviricetes sp.]
MVFRFFININRLICFNNLLLFLFYTFFTPRNITTRLMFIFSKIINWKDSPTLWAFLFY